MSHFLDLSPYTYKESGIRPNTVNIGWLDKDFGYDTGAATSEFLDRLWEYCWLRFVATRGFHVCDLCEKQELFIEATRGTKKLRLGSAEIRVFGEGDIIFAAPDLVFHYVSEHNYLPPGEFVQAVLTSPPPTSEEYHGKVDRFALQYKRADY